MKKIYLLVCLLGFFGFLSAQTFTTTPSTSVSGSVDVNHSLDLYIHFPIAGNAQGSRQLRWKETSFQFPPNAVSAWLVTICDDTFCYNSPDPMAHMMAPNVAGQEGFLKMNATPLSPTGAGMATYHVWDVNDSAASNSTVTFTFNVNGLAVSVLQSGKLVSVSPSPANDVLHLTAKNGLFDRGIVQIFDLQGKLALQESIGGVQNVDLDVRDLEVGIYLLRYTSKNDVMTQKVVIAR
jgi:hypothetical protein